MSIRPQIAVIDVGSNSIKLLIATVGTSPGRIETIFAETLETRISDGISRALPSLSRAAMAAGLQSIEELFRLAQGYRPCEIHIVATSAVRDALNGLEFRDAVEAATGIHMRILSGPEEARSIGHGLACDPNIKESDPFLQMDLGGGSLEFIRFELGQLTAATSLQLGAVRLSERFIADRNAPIPASTERLIQDHVATCIAEKGLARLQQSGPLIATGGAFTVTRAILAARAGTTLDTFSPQLSLEQIAQLKSELMALPLHERMATPHLPAARADIFPTALITIEQVMHLSGHTELTHSLYNLRYGIAAERLRSLTGASVAP